MRTSPNNWDNIVDSGNFHYETKVTIEGRTYGEDDIIRLTRTISAMGSEVFPSVGAAIAGELEIELRNSNNGAVYNVSRRATLIPYIRVADDDGQYSDWLKKGEYFIDTREIDKQSGNIIFHCFDAMLKTEQPYYQTEGVIYSHGRLTLQNVYATYENGRVTLYPSSIYGGYAGGRLTLDLDMSAGTWTADIVVADIAAQIGIDVNIRTVQDLGNRAILVPNYAGNYTMRELLQFIAVAYGGNFIINDEGELAFVFLSTLPIPDVFDAGTIQPWTEGTVLDFGRIEPWDEITEFYGGIITPWNADAAVPDVIDIGKHAQTFERDFIIPEYGKIIINVNDTDAYVSGEGDTVLELECPFASQQIADILYMRLGTYIYVPFHAGRALLTPLFEFGDEVVIDSVNVKPYNIVETFNQLLPMDLSAESAEEINHEYEYESPEEREIKRLSANTMAEFSVLNDRIESKVSSTDYDGRTIASLINQSAESVTIDASHINLNGVVTANENFKINDDGSFEANKGTIGYLTIQDGVLTATYIKTYTYTNADLTRIQQIIQGTVTPTDDDFEKYDLNGDGVISALDYVRLKKVVDDYEGVVECTVTIDAQDFGNIIKVETDTGAQPTTIGALAIHVNNLFAGQSSFDGAVDISGRLTGGSNAVFDGSVTATSFINSSLAEKKKDIEPFKGSALDKLDATDIYRFRYANEAAAAKLHTGVVIGKDYRCCDDIISGEGIDTYAMISVLWQAVKELKAEIEELKGGK